jgi:hypothetical protein
MTAADDCGLVALRASDAWAHSTAPAPVRGERTADQRKLRSISTIGVNPITFSPLAVVLSFCFSI